VTARCRGLVATDDRFDSHFDDALRLFNAAEMPFQAARTALNYGERLRRTGRRREARAQLQAALEIFHRLGAATWAYKTEKELRATGERIRRRDPSAAEQLTPQELQIALAVADGATNREAAASLFLSHKTIEHHLSVIYRKLGLRSRTELARALTAEVAHATGAQKTVGPIQA
jgi:DNA-binding NarL/FixJ family response regulator